MKFTKRDRRDRAGREYAALRLLQHRNPALAPRPILMDRDNYQLPVVVQTWVAGEMAQRPPQSDGEWSRWLQHTAAIHEIGPAANDGELANCWSNCNGSTGYETELRALHRSTEAEHLPGEVRELIGRLRRQKLERWPALAPRLCRADHNVRNFIADGHCLRSVDWEYSGWGDPIEDLAELMTHVTYMAMPNWRWSEVVSEYSHQLEFPDITARLQVCLAIKTIGWLVRLARSLSAQTHASDLRLPGALWRRNTNEKYQYYIDRIRTDDLLVMLRG